MNALGKKLTAEALGTFWLVFIGCGSVVLWQALANGMLGRELRGVPVSIAFVIPHVIGIALAFGLAVTTMAYTIGHISGCHLNPAVSIGLVVSGRMDSKDLGPYVGAQIVGGLLAAGALVILAKGMPGDYNLKDMGVGANDYHKLMPAFLGEIILTFFFMLIILGATSKRAPAAMAGLVIGLGLTIIHIVGIPLDGVSVNPARSIGPALFQRGDALKHLWVFIVAPPIGAAAAGVVYKILDSEG